MRNQDLHAAKLEAADKVAKLAVVMGLPEEERDAQDLLKLTKRSSQSAWN
jgi:hypothetical protein